MKIIFIIQNLIAGTFLQMGDETIVWKDNVGEAFAFDTYSEAEDFITNYPATPELTPGFYGIDKVFVKHENAEGNSLGSDTQHD